jgi:hypothetical protein
MLPSDNYLLSIAPATARGPANKTTMKKGPSLLATLMAATVRQYNIACIDSGGGPGFLKKTLDTPIGQVLQPIVAIGHAYAGFFSVFSLSTCRNRSCADVKAPIISLSAKSVLAGEKLVATYSISM